ncbi:2-hydroxyacid dehydrogenase [Marinobacterium rhizophilum]|uniref:2-hydroxyacid dehydrogenase n=1 Tax=Marinobacterium rhizophilum TaxID=420402 RepID=UPI00037DB900|nr:2-hydroxyacid dehydrogenase [Marinobacterium rhizophilum]
MNVLVYSSRKDEKPFLQHAFEGTSYRLQFEDSHLTPRTARLAVGFDAISVFVNDRVSAAVIEVLAEVGVKTIALRCAGYNNVDLAAAKAGGMAVVRVPAYSPYAVAEHAVALILSLNRHIHKAYNRVRDGNFALDGLLGFDLHGKTVGVIGTGSIGAVFCRIMRGFGCQVLAHDVAPNADCLALGVEYRTLGELLAQADILSLHCPLTPATHHLIDQAALAQMKPGAFLVNTSRGGLIDTPAVIAALKSEHLGGLAIDVYEEEADFFFEDLSDRVIADDDLMRLTTFPNVLVTGHQAFLTREALTNIADCTRDNLEQLARGEPCNNQL